MWHAIFAQSIGEYGGAGGGIVQAIERAATSASQWVANSVAEYTWGWIVAACLAALLLFRRK